jgi:membrane-anchored glycerophosphoryl diester phosphodiesterase (GDPDase)
MTLPDNVGKVANNTIDALRHHPVMILMIVLNMMFLALIYFGVRDTKAYQAQEFELVLKSCFSPANKQE